MSAFKTFAGMAPVNDIGEDEPQEGIGVCLSGGGYRAMLFHLGSFWRLYEAELLEKMVRISSVSGGSITSAYVGLRWGSISGSSDPERFRSNIVGPICKLASKSIDVPSILTGAIWKGNAGDHIATAYKEHLFGDATLQDFPDSPRFVINATSLQSGVLFRFSKPYARDYRVGSIDHPKIPIAHAVASSSAFPPFLSPFILKCSPEEFTDGSGTDLQHKEYRSDIVLSDGGVYDNLGLETVWKNLQTVLVSDAGGKMVPDESPHEDWLLQTVRVLDVIDNQVRSLRKRQLMEAFDHEIRKGAYWGIRTDISDYAISDFKLSFPHEKTMELANISTRLKKLDTETQEKLINWGYSVSDAALRTYFDRTIPSGNLPFPARV